MLCLIILVYLLQVHCFDIEKLNRMYEGRYILDLQIFIFLPSLLVEYVERGHRQRRRGGGGGAQGINTYFYSLTIIWNLAPIGSILYTKLLLKSILSKVAKEWQRIEILYVYND